jgi:hypothetical protein
VRVDRQGSGNQLIGFSFAMKARPAKGWPFSLAQEFLRKTGSLRTLNMREKLLIQ